MSRGIAALVDLASRRRVVIVAVAAACLAVAMAVIVVGGSGAPAPAESAERAPDGGGAELARGPVSDAGVPTAGNETGGPGEEDQEAELDEEAGEEELDDAPAPTPDVSGVDREQVVAGIASIKPDLRSCRGREPANGTIRLLVSSGGAVKDVTVTGMLAGTRTGACVAEAARKGIFPAMRRDNVRVIWPFVLPALEQGREPADEQLP